MKVRVLTSIGIAVFGLPLLFLSEYLVYPVAVGLLCVCALFEMARVMGFSKSPAVTVPAYLIGLAMPIITYYLKPEYYATYILISVIVIFAYLLYLFGYAVLCRGRVSFSSIGGHFTAFAYIAVSFTSLAMVRYIENGVYYFALVFVASWVCDVFAYLVGRAMGKHKLIEEISPKKTVEGSIGGIVCTTLCFGLYGLIISLVSDLVPNYLVLFVLGFALSIVAQFGDLIASLIKREHGVKDYGNIFPGHGGVLDRFDSILATAPILLAVCAFFPPFR